MSDPISTLFDAFAAAGDDGSALDRALRGFQTPTQPNLSPRSNTDFISQVFSTGQSQPVAPQTTPSHPQDVIPEPVRDVAGRIGQAVFSGSSFLDLVLPGTPGSALKEQFAGKNRLAAEITDAVFSPATLAVALRGLQLAGIVSKIPVIGPLASNLVKPILATKNSSDIARFGVEAGAVAGAFALPELGKTISTGVWNEDLPFPAQLALMVLGGVAGSKAAMKAIVNPADAVEVLAKTHPNGLLAGIYKEANLPPNPSVADFAALDDNSRFLRGESLKAAAGLRPEIVLPDNLPETARNAFGFVQNTLARNIKSLPAEANEAFTNAFPVTSAYGIKFDPNAGPMGRMLNNIGQTLDGDLGRNAIGRQVATLWHNKSAADQRAIEQFAAMQTKVMDEVFGKNRELIQPKMAVIREDTEAKLAVYRKGLAATNARRTVLDEQLARIRGEVPDTALGEFGVGDAAIALADPEHYRALMNERNVLRNHAAGLERQIKSLSDTLADDTVMSSKIRNLLYNFREGYLKASGGKEVNDQAIMQLVTRHPDYFDLNDTQKAWLEATANLFDNSYAYDATLGLKYKKVDYPYSPQVWDFNEFKPDGSIGPASKASRGAYFSKVIGRERGFQMPRIFDDIVEWMDVLGDAKDAPTWNRRITAAIDEAVSKGDTERVKNLSDLLESNLIPVPRQEPYPITLARRLQEASQARWELSALNTAREIGGDLAAEEVSRRYNPATNAVLRALGMVAAVPKALILRFDASVLGVQFLSGVAMSGGMKDALRTNIKNVLSTIGTAEGFAKYYMSKADSITNMLTHNMTGFPSEMSIVSEGLDDLATTGFFAPSYYGKSTVKTVTGENWLLGGSPVQTRGNDYNLYGKALRWLDTVQFSRAMFVMKVETNEYLMSVLKAAKEHDGFFEMARKGLPFLGAMDRRALQSMTEDDMMRLVTEFSNNIYGGRNRVALGRSATHQLVESLLLLTPGFTRGTLYTAISTLKPGVEGALARDYAVRSMALAGTLVTLLTGAVNGVSIVDGKPQFVMPNLFDPTANDWFDIPIPGGSSIRPMARFRSLGKIVFGSLEEAAVKNDPEKALKYWTDDAVRWWTYRQSALISTLAGDPVGAFLGEQRGNSFVRNTGLSSLISNPGVGKETLGMKIPGRAIDFYELVTRNVMPISLFAAVEAIQQNGVTTLPAWRQLMLAVGSQIVGASEFGPSILESSVASRAAELSVAAGMDADTADRLARMGRTPVSAKNSAGQYLLTSDQRRAINQQLSVEYGISEDLAAKGGRIEPRERQQIVKTQEEQQIGTYFDATDAAKTQYKARVNVLDGALSRGAIDAVTYRDELTKARIARAGAYQAAQEAAPQALVYLNSPKYRGKQNADDAVTAAISAEVFADDFIDPETGTFDFTKQQEAFERARAKYGDEAFVLWQKHADANKSPVELARDKAMRTLAPYFDVADYVWEAAVGVTSSERDFDSQLREMLIKNNVPREYLSLALSTVKQGIEPVQDAHSVITVLRKAMRLANPEIDKAAMVWLGAKPVSP